MGLPANYTEKDAQKRFIEHGGCGVKNENGLMCLLKTGHDGDHFTPDDGGTGTFWKT